MEEQVSQAVQGQATGTNPIVGLQILTSQANTGNDDASMMGSMRHEATLANGIIASTRVSRRVMMNASRHPRMELNQVDDFDPPPKDDMSEVTIPAALEDGSRTGDDDVGGGTFDGDDDDYFACPHQDAVVVEDDDGQSYMAHVIPPGAPRIDGDGDNMERRPLEFVNPFLSKQLFPCF